MTGDLMRAGSSMGNCSAQVCLGMSFVAASFAFATCFAVFVDASLHFLP